MLLIGLFYIFFPLVMIAMLLFKRQPNLLMWILTVLVSGLSILFIWTIARWEIISIYFRPIIPLLFVIAVYISFKKIRKPTKPTSKASKIIMIVINIFIIVFMGTMSFLALRGYRTPANTVEISSPFKEGKQIVLHGGSRPMVNAHFHVNPQNYAVDIVGLNSFGMRANSISGGNILTDYVIYDMPVYSPVNGKVMVVVDGLEDLIPPNTDAKNIAGNHVLIKFEEKELLLAHLKNGSIKVKVGDIVDTNTLIGNVGNTGNTSEPHLHLHIETGGEPNTILNGTSVPFKINHQFLIRGDQLNE